MARSARRSVPLQRFLQDGGLALGGRPGVRFARRRAVATSRMTLLRLVRALPEPALNAPAVLGIDEFALRRGRRSGSVIIDLEAHRPVDLLPERTSEAFAAWLTEHGQPNIVCRDRGGEYAIGARQGAPDAIHVADRWHLLKNVGDALERVLGRYPEALRLAAGAGVAAGLPDRWGGTPPWPAPAPASPPRQDARLGRYAEAVALHRHGASVSAISRAVGATRPTVRRWLRAGRFPERARRPRHLHDRSPHAAYLRERWAAGCCNAMEVWRAVRGRGFAGSSVTVRRSVQRGRAYPYQQRATGRPAGAPPRTPAPPSAPPHPPSPRQVRWWLLARTDEVTVEQGAYVERLRAACPAVARAAALPVAFGRLVRERDLAAFAPWLAAMTTSEAPEFRELAARMQRDRAAIEAALTNEWSSGQVEGQVTKIKLVKRQGDGRAKFDLLRKRVLLAS